MDGRWGVRGGGGWSAPPPKYYYGLTRSCCTSASEFLYMYGQWKKIHNWIDGTVDFQNYERCASHKEAVEVMVILPTKTRHRRTFVLPACHTEGKQLTSPFFTITSTRTYYTHTYVKFSLQLTMRPWSAPLNLNSTRVAAQISGIASIQFLLNTS